MDSGGLRGDVSVMSSLDVDVVARLRFLRGGRLVYGRMY